MQTLSDKSPRLDVLPIKLSTKKSYDVLLKKYLNFDSTKLEKLMTKKFENITRTHQPG